MVFFYFEQLTCMHIGQIDNMRRVVQSGQREAAIVHQWTGTLESDRLNPVGGLRVEDIEMCFRVD